MTITDRIIHETFAFKRLVKIAGDRRPFHAYLLVGSSNSTLLHFSRTFAAWLHCSTDGPTACGVCTDCLLSHARTHPAFHVVSPEGNELSIESVRTVIERVEYKTTGGRYRVFAFEKADAMGEEAANAFLKTLEEPPPNTVFILSTTRPDAVLSTIASRCITTRVQSPSPEVIIEDLLPNQTIDSALVYTSLLLTNSSLELVDALAAGRARSTPPSALPSLIDDFLRHVPPSLLLSSPEPFAADFAYPLALFGWVLRWLTGSSCPPSAPSALTMAVSFLAANHTIGTALKDHFKAAERAFTATYGKGRSDPSLDAAACRRRVRRVATHHVLLLLDCLQVATRLSLRLRADGSLPFRVEGVFPELERLAAFPETRLPELRRVIVDCRRRLFANVTEKPMLFDVFTQLQRIFAGLPSELPPMIPPKGGV